MKKIIIILFIVFGFFLNLLEKLCKSTNSKSCKLLNTLSELATAINNDASFSTTMTYLIATKAGLTSNNTISGANIFSGNNTFNSSFGSVNTNDSSLNWSIALNSVFNINTINSVNETISGTGIINNLYSNILAINNNNNTRKSINDIFEVATSSTGNYLYYNNSSTFGFINVSRSAINPSLTTPTRAITTLTSTTGTITTLTSTTGTITTLTSTTGTITNLYSNILAVNNNNTRRATNDIVEVATKILVHSVI